MSPYRTASPHPGALNPEVTEVFLGGEWWRIKQLVVLKMRGLLHELPEAAKDDLARLLTEMSKEPHPVFKWVAADWHPALLGESPAEI